MSITSWIWGTSQLDDAIDKATSELLPAGSEDIALNLEICDQIRSKSAPAKDAMKGLKRRLNHKNPNVQLLALSLTDTCVKNGGDAFLSEIASREFMDNLVSILKMPGLNLDVKNMILKLVQNWSVAFEGKAGLSYVGQVYKGLLNEGYKFPPKDLALANSAMVDTQTAPEWIDSDVCLRCRTAFTFTNRKHHCRNCGQVFDQGCSSKSLPLPHFGITQEVRVCDGCFNKLTKKKNETPGGGKHSSRKSVDFSDWAVDKSKSSKDRDRKGSNKTNGQDLEDAELQRAIQLSLQEAASAGGSSRTGGYVPSQPSPTKWQVSEPPIVGSRTGYGKSAKLDAVDEEDDPDLRAAIEASLREANAPKPSAPAAVEERYEGYQPQQERYAPKPSITTLPNHDLDPLEEDAILTFNQTVEQVEAQGGRDLSKYPAVTSLYDKASSLRPKLAVSLDDTTRKQELLSEMNSKLSEAVKLYDQILTQQVSQPRYRAPAPYQSPTNVYQPAGYAATQWTTQSPVAVPSSPPPVQWSHQHTGYQPQYAPMAPPVDQYAPVLSPPPPPQAGLARSPSVMYAPAPVPPVAAVNPDDERLRAEAALIAEQERRRYEEMERQRVDQLRQLRQDQMKQSLLVNAPSAPSALPYMPSVPTNPIPASYGQTNGVEREERKEALLIDL